MQLISGLLLFLLSSTLFVELVFNLHLSLSISLYNTWMLICYFLLKHSHEQSSDFIVISSSTRINKTSWFSCIWYSSHQFLMWSSSSLLDVTQNIIDNPNVQPQAVFTQRPPIICIICERWKWSSYHNQTQHRMHLIKSIRRLVLVGTINIKLCRFCINHPIYERQ